MDTGKLKDQYFGEVAKEYEKERKDNPKWQREQEVVLGFLEKIKNEVDNVLDIPVGTGRFFEFYKQFNFSVLGADISTDMLKEAQNRSQELNFDVSFSQENIFSLSEKEYLFDLVVCIRFLNWVNTKDFSRALKELVDVSNRYVMLGVRVYPKNKLFQQIRYRVIKIIKHRPRIIIHSERTVLRQFKNKGVNIIEKQMIDKKHGGVYYIFLLEKKFHENV